MNNRVTALSRIKKKKYKFVKKEPEQKTKNQ